MMAGMNLRAAWRRGAGFMVGRKVDWRMNHNVGALGFEAKRDAIVARTLRGGTGPAARRGAPSRAPRRSLPSLALGGPAAADDGAGRCAIFPGVRRHWPTVEALAAAPTKSVISAFAGLGYYSRARNMHACAQEIARRGGRFPADEAALRALPGVGAYTAAAIAAIAFDRQAAPVDGNIARILARLLGLDAVVLRMRNRRAARALAPRRAGDCQALMDIGATVCRPRGPDCATCPLARIARLTLRGAGGVSAPRPRPSRGEQAPSFSLTGKMGPSLPGGGRREACSHRPSNFRAPRGRLKVQAQPGLRGRRSPGDGAACQAPSTRSSPISR